MTKQEAIAIYNKFPKEKQDITRDEFVKQVLALTDPVQAQSDVGRILHARHQQAIIDRAVYNG
jgi:hypothetical protein